MHFAARVVLVIALLSFLLPFFQPFYLAGDPSTLALLAITCGVFGGGYFVATFTAQRKVEAGLSTLVMNIYTPVTIVLASVFLNERLTSMQLVGTILLLIGMVIVAKKHRIGNVKFDKHFLLMLVGGIMLGIALTAERALQKATGFSAGAMISWWSQAIFLTAAAYLLQSKSHYSQKDTLNTGFYRFLQQVSWVTLLFVAGNLSLVSAVTTFKVVIYIYCSRYLPKRA